MEGGQNDGKGKLVNEKIQTISSRREMNRLQTKRHSPRTESHHSCDWTYCPILNEPIVLLVCFGHRISIKS